MKIVASKSPIKKMQDLRDAIIKNFDGIFTDQTPTIPGREFPGFILFCKTKNKTVSCAYKSSFTPGMKDKIDYFEFNMVTSPAKPVDVVGERTENLGNFKTYLLRIKDFLS